MINIYFKTIRDKKFKKVDQFRVGSWINVEDATVEDLEKIAELSDLEYFDLQDSLDNYELPRIERQDDKTLIFIRNPAEKSELYTQVLTIVLSKKYLITISPGKNEIISSLLEQSTQLATTQQAKLLIKVLLKIAQRFTSKIKEARGNVLRRKKTLGAIDSRDIAELSENEEILSQYISALVPMTSVIEALIARKSVHMYEEDEDLLQDLQVAIKQSADNCTVSIKSIRSLRDSYQVIFTNELNKTIKVLTTLTIFLTIPTIVASLFGMNVGLPFETNPLGFVYILGIIAIGILLALIIFVYKKWL